MYTRKFLSALLLVLAGLAVWADSAGPCSCEQDKSPKFLVPDGITFPADFRGVPCVNLKDVDRSRVAVFSMTEDFYERAAAQQKVTVDAKLEVPSLPEEYAGKFNPWYRAETRQGDDGQVSLICAEWQPGRTYRVRMEQQEIIIHVSTRTFEARPATIETWQDEHSVILTSTASGSCSTILSGHRVGVELAGSAVSQWRDALLYFTIVDDMAWRPEFSICDAVPPGMSWVGPARELLYGDCGREHEPQGLIVSATPLWNLKPASHRVTMIAWLPGVTVVSATRTITIDCE